MKRATFYFVDGRDPIIFEVTMQAKLVKLYAWATSRQGIHDIGVAVSAAVALYTGLHKAGVI